MIASITVPVTVTWVNHAPTITTASTVLSVNAGVTKRYTVALDGGDPGVVQTMSPVVTTDNPLVATATFTASGSAYTLNVKGVSGGVANIKLFIRDNGGILNGGVDSTSVVFNITVNATGIDETGNSIISLYPNPTDDNIFVTLNNENPESVIITDTYGRVIVEKAVTGTNNRFKLSVASLQRGLYFITVKSNVQSHTLKFVRR